jgi:prevent-host-death family protein
MSKRYSIADARASLSNIVDQAEAGQTVELTRRGKPVAVVISLQRFEGLLGDRPLFTAAYEDFLKRYALEDIGLDEQFSQSLREKSAGREVSL